MSMRKGTGVTNFRGLKKQIPVAEIARFFLLLWKQQRSCENGVCFCVFRFSLLVVSTLKNFTQRSKHLSERKETAHHRKMFYVNSE